MIRNNKKACCLLLAAAGLIFAACTKQLNKIPETTLSDAAFWKTSSDLRDACNSFYVVLPAIQSNDAAVWSDDGFGTAPNTISDGSRLVPVTSGDWSDKYSLIRKCNNVLEKSSRVSDDPEQVDRYRGEARFFRAFAYMELVKRYGDVPLILRTFDVNDTLTEAYRTARETVMDSIYADLDFAIAHLPVASKLPQAEYGRATRGAALFLKASAGLFEGTWNKFHQQGDASRHLNIALEASEQIINSGEYALFTYAPLPDSSYFYLFQNAGEGPANKENILVRLYGENMNNSIASHNYVRSIWGGSVTPTKSLMDAYLYKDGLPAGKSPWEKPQTNTLSQYENRDPRMDMTVFNKRHWFINSLYVPSFQNTLTGYKSRKYFISVDWTINQSYVDNIIMRYAEVLLMFAEAKYELNGQISDDDLNRSVNLIRHRVGMPPLTNAFVAEHSLSMREEIRRERRVELALEGDHRYWDLIRWKTAETVLPQAVLGTKFFPDEYVDVTNPKLTPEGFVIAQDAAKRKFDPDKDYLWPLPTKELGLDIHLSQNPQW
ncbi:RagB/SusD family nutrient uptake outer membrane protein [Compostibacter hankyongensis]